jgi:hypothetical protein
LLMTPMAHGAERREEQECALTCAMSRAPQGAITVHTTLFTRPQDPGGRYGARQQFGY